MKPIASLFIALTCLAQLSNGQGNYLSDIITKNDNRISNGYLIIPFNYWRFDTCLYKPNSICKYNSSTAANVKTYYNNENITYEFLRGNNSGYQSKNPYDTFKYIFIPKNLNTSLLVRKLLIKDQYIRTDTFKLTSIDTLLFENNKLIKKVFGKPGIEKQMSFNIYVLKSADSVGSIMLHYWVERIGIIKLTDEKCWRYSFEIRDNRTKSLNKMFTQLIKIIKSKYKDPYWLSEPCSFE